MPTHTTTRQEPAEFTIELARAGLSPLWENLHNLVPPEPRPAAHPAHWRYVEDIRPLLFEAGARISTGQAERRVLVLENPGLPGQSATTGSLYAGYQLVLPGEIARAHRHSQSALRFVIEGKGAFTTVSGEQLRMAPGDLVLTPRWTWHDHGNDSDAPIVWLDGLDIPLVNFLNAGFAEPSDQEIQPVTKAAGDTLARFGANMAPASWRAEPHQAPLLHYPYARTRAALAALAAAERPDPHHGHRLRYVNPANGGDVLPTMAAYLQLIPGAFATKPYQTTESTLFVVAEGEGRSHVGGQAYNWRRHDTFVAPSWVEVSHEAKSESVLFSFSDMPVQRALGLWRDKISE